MSLTLIASDTELRVYYPDGVGLVNVYAAQKCLFWIISGGTGVTYSMKDDLSEPVFNINSDEIRSYTNSILIVIWRSVRCNF